MKDIAALPQVSSLETILNSIRHDGQVCRWFTLLVGQPALQKKLLTADQAILNKYRLLKKLVLQQLLITGIFFVLLGLYSSQKQYSFLLVAGLLIYPALKLYSQKKETVAQISHSLLLSDYTPDSLRHTSLYQLAEVYSREYKIPSLVDTVYHWDQILRLIVVGTFFFFNFIYPVEFWNCIFYILLSLALGRVLIQLNFFYRRLA